MISIKNIPPLLQDYSQTISFVDFMVWIQMTIKRHEAWSTLPFINVRL